MYFLVLFLQKSLFPRSSQFELFFAKFMIIYYLKKIQKSIKMPLGCDYRHGFVSAYMKISHEMSK